MKPKIVLLNAPAAVGKSRAMKYIKEQGLELEYASCKDPLHRVVIPLFGMAPDKYWKIYNDPILKETPLVDFSINLSLPDKQVLLQSLKKPWDYFETEGRVVTCNGKETYTLSLREAMIYTSEVIMKPRFGNDIFGKIRAESLGDGLYIDDSTAAFEIDGVLHADELQPLISKMGQENILLIRIHREGFTFEGDSRRYIPDGICENTIDINNVEEYAFYNQVYEVVYNFIHK